MTLSLEHFLNEAKYDKDNKGKENTKRKRVEETRWGGEGRRGKKNKEKQKKKNEKT